VDQAGQPFKRVQARDALDLPLVSGVDRDAYLSDRPAWEGRIPQALEVAAQYQSRFPGPSVRLSEVRLSAQGLSLFAGPHAEEIHLGEGPVADQLDRLKTVRRALQDRALVAEVIRLDNRVRPGWVAVKALSISAPPSERSGGARPTRGPEGTR
jgi:cell division protein FtsQ